MKIERIDICNTDYGEVVKGTFIIDKNELDEIGDDYVIYKGDKYSYLGEPPIINEEYMEELRREYNGE